MLKAREDVGLFMVIPAFKIGTTLTCDNDRDSLEWESGADTPNVRLNVLRFFHAQGIKTFVSFEPVLFPSQTLRLIETVAPFVDEIKIGRWNHSAAAARIDWREFGEKAVTLARSLKLNFYVKDDLRAAMQGFQFTPAESDYRMHELGPQ
jgi:DNA repair photolyase